MTEEMSLRPSGDVVVMLRRYTDDPCDIGGYHNAFTIIEERTEVLDDDGNFVPLDPVEWICDVRWPDRCECGYAFSGLDGYQVRQRRIWVDMATGQRTMLTCIEEVLS